MKTKIIFAIVVGLSLLLTLLYSLKGNNESGIEQTNSSYPSSGEIPDGSEFIEEKFDEEREEDDVIPAPRDESEIPEGELEDVEALDEGDQAVEQKINKTDSASRQIIEEDRFTGGLYKSSSHLKNFNSKMKKLMGKFEGVLSYEVGKNKGRRDRVVMEMNFEQEKKELQGDATISLFTPSGEEYSYVRGSGVNKTISSHPKREDWLFVQTSPKNYFVFFVGNSEQLRGNYYEGDIYLGTVVLNPE